MPNKKKCRDQSQNLMKVQGLMTHLNQEIKNGLWCLRSLELDGNKYLLSLTRSYGSNSILRI